MNFLGAHWQVRIWGYITLVAGAITFAPQSVEFLPENWQKYIKGICGLITLVAGGAFVANVKGSQVTGGTVQQTASGDVASTPSVAVNRTLQAK